MLYYHSSFFPSNFLEDFQWKILAHAAIKFYKGLLYKIAPP